MKHIHLCLLILLNSYSINSGFAQDSPKGRIDIMKGQEEQANTAKKDLIFKTNKPLSSVIDGPEYISGEEVCEVEISTSYYQSGDTVNVEALIDNSDCAASNGKYKVKVKTRDEAGEAQTKAYEEIWSRDDSEPITAEHKYSMQGDIELVNARIQMPSKDYCTCIEAN